LKAVLEQWQALPNANAVSEKMRWRDGRLAALRQHKNSEGEWQK
jgi:hypothetical protein